MSNEEQEGKKNVLQEAKNAILNDPSFLLALLMDKVDKEEHKVKLQRWREIINKTK